MCKRYILLIWISLMCSSPLCVKAHSDDNGANGTTVASPTEEKERKRKESWKKVLKLSDDIALIEYCALFIGDPKKENPEGWERMWQQHNNLAERLVKEVDLYIAESKDHLSKKDTPGSFTYRVWSALSLSGLRAQEKASQDPVKSCREVFKEY